MLSARPLMAGYGVEPAAPLPGGSLRDPKPNSTRTNWKVAAALKEFGITGATMAGGHGTNGKQSDLEAVIAQK
jgi:hypothetical protein